MRERNQKPFHKLRSLLKEDYDVKYAELAEAIGRCETYVALRMTGNMPWDLDDVYKIRAFINSFVPEGEPELIPLEKIAEFFPPRHYLPLRKREKTA